MSCKTIGIWVKNSQFERSGTQAAKSAKKPVKIKLEVLGRSARIWAIWKSQMIFYKVLLIFYLNDFDLFLEVEGLIFVDFQGYFPKKSIFRNV